MKTRKTRKEKGRRKGKKWVSEEILVSVKSVST